MKTLTVLFLILTSKCLIAADQIPPAPPVDCLGYENTLFLARNTVVLRNVRWRIRSTGQVGCGMSIPHRQDTGHFWFFGSDNIELTCKVLDGRSFTNHYWIFCGALTDVEWWLEASNNANPETLLRAYYNPPGKMASFSDVNAVPSGPNAAPFFSELNCGTTIRVNGPGSGAISTFVQDPDNDELTARVKILEGDDGSLEITPQWSNPITDSAAGQYIYSVHRWPDVNKEYVIAVELTDDKVQMPSRCTFTLQVIDPDGP